MATDRDQTFMTEALTLAAKGRGDVEPNPMVGCVIVAGDQIIGRGYHQRFGGPHAERQALADCRAQGHDPAGATMYVTLEPCCHDGKTPPCTDAIIEARIARVVVAMVDPFEHVAGQGIRLLQDAGIDVTIGIGERSAHQLNEPFVKRVATGLPWVILKWAQTLDGKIATATGDSKWISSDASRRYVHEIRSRVDAVMVGIGTVLADDPELTAREVPLHRRARRVVIDPDLRLPSDCKLATNPEGLILAVRQSLIERGDPRVLDWEAQRVGIVGLPTLPDGRLSLEPLLAQLVQQFNATNVLVEGGSGLASSLLSQGLVDQVLAFVAPRILGDIRGLAAVGGWDHANMADAMPLTLRNIRRIENDVLLDYRTAEA